MIPGPVKNPANGIAQVINAYIRHLPKFGVEFTNENDYDLLAVHAGSAKGDVAHNHGLYWTADYAAKDWEYKTNADVIETLRHAQVITVPTQWVAETIRRDMHIDPFVVPHGVEWQEWQTIEQRHNYVLYNKNRQGDVCDSTPVDELAKLAQDTIFVSTFGRPAQNVKVTGVVKYSDMRKIIMSAGVYVSTTKETFGIGTLEAMSSGVPILGYRWGGTAELIEHGVTGYLAEPGDIDDLLEGLRYCQKYNRILGENAREAAKKWTWENACSIVAKAYRTAETKKKAPSSVAIVIPLYNYAGYVEKALRSAISQDYENIIDIIVVDDGSTDNPDPVVEKYINIDSRVRYIKKTNGGVATARNAGIEATTAKYVTCLDADDEISPTFISALVPELDNDNSLGIAFTSLNIIDGNGKKVRGGWPHGYSFDLQASGQNQVPTCCMFRREAWEKLLGYRQRYAPGGCGTEDAELWLRMGSIGYGAKHVTEEPLFQYYLGGRSTHRPETKWLDWHPWTKDGFYPFAAQATPAHHSHPVMQYDTPVVSVVIPVGPNHEHLVQEALDSLEAQTVRSWEAIVVWDDNENENEKTAIEKAFPFCKFLRTTNEEGAGAARNLGASIARGVFLLFLDADDWLVNDALEIMLDAYSELDSPAVIYTESYGIRAVDENVANDYAVHNELVKYENGIATVFQPVADYDYNLAIRQPFTPSPYFWCYISSLIPTEWHNAVGGFDESLDTWEDWDYWIRVAKAGYDFVAVHEPCLVYCYDTGARREAGKSIKRELRDALAEKHKEVSVMACSGCGGKRSSFNRTVPSSAPSQTYERSTAVQQDDNFIMCEYQPPRGGSHGVVGNAVFSDRYIQNMRKVPNGWSINYGYHSKGDKFLVHREDQKLNQTWFVPVQLPSAQRTITVPKVQAKPVAPPPPREFVPTEKAVLKNTVDEEPIHFDFQILPGVNEKLSDAINEFGVHSLEDLIEVGDAITDVKGIGQAKAETIVAAAMEKLAVKPQDPENILKELESVLGEIRD